jgi:hypothetical protein
VNVVIGSKATATFTSQGGKQEILTMHGNWLDTNADIVDEAMNGTYTISLLQLSQTNMLDSKVP